MKSATMNAKSEMHVCDHCGWTRLRVGHTITYPYQRRLEVESCAT